MSEQGSNTPVPLHAEPIPAMPDGSAPTFEPRSSKPRPQPRLSELEAEVERLRAEQEALVDQVEKVWLERDEARRIAADLAADYWDSLTDDERATVVSWEAQTDE